MCVRFTIITPSKNIFMFIISSTKVVKKILLKCQGGYDAIPNSSLVPRNHATDIPQDIKEKRFTIYTTACVFPKPNSIYIK